MEEKKLVYRMPPCPDHDLEAMESWLTDLAEAGLTLEPENLFFGFFTFSRTAPQKIRYRLEPAAQTQRFWEADPGQPKQALLELSEDMGWEYVLRYGDFFIYRSTDPHAPELHTDPVIQAATLDVLKKQQRSTFLSELVLIAVYSLWGAMGYPVGLCLALGTPAASVLAILLLHQLLRPLGYLSCLNKLRRKLAESGLNHRKDWKSGAKRYYAGKILNTCAWIFLIAAVFAMWIRDTETEMELADFTGDPPFVTIADLNPSGHYEEKGLGYGNTLRQWSDFLSPVNWEWDELGQVTMADGTTLYGSLNVTYHETAAPFLAHQLAREFIHYGREHPLAPAPAVTREEIHGVTILRFTGKYHYRSVVLISENTVVKGDFLIDSSEVNLIESIWTALMTERLIASNTT